MAVKDALKRAKNSFVSFDLTEANRVLFDSESNNPFRAGHLVCEEELKNHFQDSKALYAIESEEDFEKTMSIIAKLIKSRKHLDKIQSETPPSEYSSESDSDSEIPELNNDFESEEKILSTTTDYLHHQCQCLVRSDINCGCFSDDYLFLKQGGVYKDFAQKIYDTLESMYDSHVVMKKIGRARLNADLNDDQFLSHEVNAFKDRISRNATFIMLNDMSDKNIVKMFKTNEVEVDTDFMALVHLYHLRELNNDFKDYGMRNNWSIKSGLSYSVVRKKMERYFNSQGLAASRFAMSSQEDPMSPRAFVEFTIKKVWKKITGSMSFISEYIKGLVDKVFNYFGRFLRECVLGPFFADFHETCAAVQKVTLEMSIFFVSFLIGRLIGIVAPQVCNAIYARLFSGESPMQSQGEPSDFGLLNVLVFKVLKLSPSDAKVVKTTFKEIKDTCKEGSVSSNPYKMLLLALPKVLCLGLILCLGDAEKKNNYRLDEWRNKAAAVVSISKIQSVVGSDFYRVKITEMMKQGAKLMNNMPTEVDPTVRSNFSLIYAKMLGIQMNLIALGDGKVKSEIPYAVHIFGASGIGKTESVREVIRRCFDDDSGHIYEKDTSSAHWNGCNGEPIIVMDEFLIDTPEEQFRQAKEYLTLASGGTFRPEMASVDNPCVGIKGCILRPEVILTINNKAYTAIDHQIDRPYQRRRRYVIEFKATKECKFLSENNVDFSKYTTRELMDRKWMCCNIWPSVSSKSNKPIKRDLTFNQMIKFVTEDYEKFVETRKLYSEALNGQVVVGQTPKELLDETLRNCFSVPSQPMTLTDALINAVAPVMCAQNGIPQPNNEAYADLVEEEVRTHGELDTEINLEDTVEERSYLDMIHGTSTGVKVAIAASLLALVTGISNYVTGDEEVDTFTSQSDPKTKSSKKPRKSSNFRRADNFESQGPNVSNVVLSHDGICQKAIAIGGRWFLTYSHSIDLKVSKNGDMWKLITSSDTFDVKLNFSEMFYNEKEDICLIHFSEPQIPRFKNITKSFISCEDIDKINNCQIYMKSDDKVFYSRAQLKNNMKYSIVGTQNYMKLDQCIKYGLPTSVGDCGAAVQCISGSLANKIIGIHVCGTGAEVFEPQGAATIVTREDLNEVMASLEMSVQGPRTTVDQRPNMIYERQVDRNEIINLPVNTKLKPSAIADLLPYQRVKQPAILHESDTRSRGLCPIETSLDNLYATTSPVIDLQLVDEIEEELFEKYKDSLDFHGFKRELTFEEACKGIPKFMNSITTSTSPGYPLCNIAVKKGKTDFVWFEDGELNYTAAFKNLVLQRVSEMKTFSGGEIEHRFLGFLKDELQKLNKITAVRTRMIFANDLVSLVAFRMIFGALLSALMTNFEVTGFAVGLNQYSHDMELIYSYLSADNAVGFVAGDYKEFDMRYLKRIEQAAYRVFNRLAGYCYGVSQNCQDYLVEHETNSPFQVKDKLCKVDCSNKSGCFLTTTINNLVDNFYIRYCWKRNFRHLDFDVNAKVTVLGDDHIIAVRQGIDFNPIVIRDTMIELGQVYTSAFKDRDLTTEFSSFEDITFLGAIPRTSLQGMYTGALRKDTLFETPQWTRNNNDTLDMTVQQMIDCASQWDREFFLEYVESLKKAYEESGRLWLMNDKYYALHNTVCNRTAISGSDFSIFFAQGEVGLTNIVTSNAVSGEYENYPTVESGLASVAINEKAVNLEYGLESYVKRATFLWSSTDALGDNIASIAVPWGLLGLGNANNIQNMPFKNYIYFVTDVDILFQVNGTPTQQGALIAYFTPLTAVLPPYENRPSFSHLYLTPNDNATTTLSVPFTFFRSAMNTYAGELGEESMGQLRVGVMAPLTTGTLPSSVSISIYSRFRGKFTLPRPIPVLEEGLMKQPNRVNSYNVPIRDVTKKPVEEWKIKDGEKFSAQGATYSSTNVRNSYKISDVAGSIPIENTVGVKTQQSAKADLNMAIPLDNPPLVGGGVPMFPQFSGMSVTCGLEPTLELGLHPKQMFREMDGHRNVLETNIEHILNHRNITSSFDFTTSDVEGDVLYTIPLNSLLFEPTADSGAYTVPPSIYLLNKFLRWRADIELEFFAVKTMFHSGRLLATIAYGAPGISAGEENIFNNQVLELTGDDSWFSVKIPFNAATEYLRTYEGTGVTDAVQDYSLGTFQISVANELRASSSVVSTSVKVLVFVKFSNVQVHDVRAIDNTAVSALDVPQFFTQGDVPNVVKVEETTGSNSTPTVVSNTDSEAPGQEQSPCSLSIGRKFEHNVKDLHEVVRRHKRIYPNNGVAYPMYDNAGTTLLGRTWTFGVYPQDKFRHLFATWSGHIKYRIFVSYKPSEVTSASLQAPSVMYVPGPGETGNGGAIYAAVAEVDINGGAIRDPIDGTKSWRKSTSAVWQYAVEKPANVGQDTWMIDVSVPFTSHYNKLPIRYDEYSGRNMSNGAITIIIPEVDDYKFIVYQALGDDFRYQDFCPTDQLYSWQYRNVDGAVNATARVVFNSSLTT